jgi:tetratricopeptide (TPR) repeat protein
MRAYVWTDKSLTRHAGRFVWLSLDFEKTKNARARRRLGISAFPTLYVVDPADTQVVIRWLGGASLPQLERLFDDGELAVKGGARGPALEALIAAHRAYGAERHAEACGHYVRALSLAPEDWPGYPRAVESLMFAYMQADSAEPSVRLADTAWPRLRRTPSAAIVASLALDAAVELPDSVPGRRDWLSRYEAACHEVLQEEAGLLLADDRSGVFFSLEAAREAVGDSAGLLTLRERHLAMLEAEADRAEEPEKRAVYDSHRLTLYIELGRPEKAIAMLEQSRRDFPGDYNPPQRLATAYKAMKRWPEALAASTEAMSRAYGPRQFLVFNTRADIQLGMADTLAARRTLVTALALAEKMPEGLKSASTIRSLKARLEKLGVKPGSAKADAAR